jgi:4-hydroxybutyrate CoA-transferase
MAAGEPNYLIDAMVKNAKAYRNVEIVHVLSLGKCEYTKSEYVDNFRTNAFFFSPGSRNASAERHVDYTPIHFHQIPDCLRYRLPLDVFMIQVSPPDAQGWCSTGVACDYTHTAATEITKKIIAQVNANMPRTSGQTLIHVSKFACIVEHNDPIAELPQAHVGAVEEAIGRHVATLVRDGDCLQLGIGGIPDAVVQALGDKNDLGLHTEMFSDTTVDFLKNGVFNNTRKNFHPYRSVATFLMGTRKLYDYVDNNPAVEMLPVQYVNDPRIACQNDNLVSINSCLQVDLTGQVAADAIGWRLISGAGGQVDFVRAAAMSRGGRSIMTLPSTSRGVSKIVPFLDEGGTVTTSRFDVDYVVTEFGVAKLKWETARDRARNLINIAHLDSRPALIEAYERRFRSPFGGQ